MLWATFENCALTVVEFIDTARQTIEAGACWFTHPEIYGACLRACKRGVALKIVVNFDNVNFQPRGLDFGALEKAGAQIFAYPGPGLLHHKFAVADKNRVITGSYNWTRAEQLDHLALIEDPALAAQFSQALSAMAGKSLPLAGLAGKSPQQVSFQQLYKPVFWSLGTLRRQAVAGGKIWLTLVKTELEWRRWLTYQKHFMQLALNLEQPPATVIQDKRAFRIWMEAKALRPGARNALMRYCFRLKEGDILLALAPSATLWGCGIVGGGPEWTNAKRLEISRYVQWLAMKTPFAPEALKSLSGRYGIKIYRGSALALIDSVEGVAQDEEGPA